MVALSYGLEQTAWRLVDGDPVQRSVAHDLLVGAIDLMDRRTEAQMVSMLDSEA